MHKHINIFIKTWVADCSKSRWFMKNQWRVVFKSKSARKRRIKSFFLQRTEDSNCISNIIFVQLFQYFRAHGIQSIILRNIKNTHIMSIDMHLQCRHCMWCENYKLIEDCFSFIKVSRVKSQRTCSTIGSKSYRQCLLDGKIGVSVKVCLDEVYYRWLVLKFNEVDRGIMLDLEFWP